MRTDFEVISPAVTPKVNLAALAALGIASAAMTLRTSDGATFLPCKGSRVYTSSGRGVPGPTQIRRRRRRAGVSRAPARRPALPAGLII